MLVFVISKDNTPMMPTHPAKARKLLMSGKAHVINRDPFVIRLNYDVKTREFQTIKVGIDDGAKHAGIALVQERIKKDDKVILSGTISVTNDINSRMETRRSYRRSRRYRLRYRKPRFDNRTRTKCFVCGKNAFKGHQTCRKHKGAKPDEKNLKNYWMPPASKARKDNIVRTINKIMKWLPLSRCVVETGRFDLQKLANPDITVEGYQQGPMYNRDSVKSALIFEYGRKEKRPDGTVNIIPRCCYCGKEGVELEIEHIVPRSRQGKDNWGNLTLACKECNDNKRNRTPEEAGMTLLVKPHTFHLSRVFQYGTQLQQGKNYLANELRKLGLEVSFTYGQFTSWTRKRFGIDKTHYNDATVVAVTTYDSAKVPKMPETINRHYLIYPIPTRRRQKFNASHYSPKKGIPKGFSKEQTVNFGYTLRTLTEVNKACVLIENNKGKFKAQAVKVTEQIPNNAKLVVQKGDIVRATSAGKLLVGKVTSLMSKGTIKIKAAGSKTQVEVSLNNTTVISRKSNIIFLVDEAI